MDREIKELLTILILCLAVGFASVTTTLYLGGNVNISADEKDFDIRFTKAIVDGTDLSSDVISEDGKTISFQTKNIKSVDEKSVLEYTILNNSSIYDANVSIKCENDSTAINTSYYEITKNIAAFIPAKTSQNGNVEVKLIKPSTKDINEKFKCTLDVSAKERHAMG